MRNWPARSPWSKPHWIVNRPDPADGLDVLGKVGGFEIGGIAGLVLGAAAHRKPVLVDGFISTAGALIARALCPTSIEYVIAAHRSVEPGHRAMHHCWVSSRCWTSTCG